VSDSARTVGNGQSGWLSDRVSDVVNGDDSWRRTVSRKGSSNDGGVLGDILGGLVHRRRCRLRVHRRRRRRRSRLRVHRRRRRWWCGMCVHRRRRCGMRVHRRRLGRLIAVFLVLWLFVAIITTAASSNCSSKRRSGRHDLNETHVCGINEGQKTQS
jgi:hypothetical protein